MSGGNTICVATVLLETGMVPMREPVTELTLESPAGLIKLRCECRDGKVRSVRFVNQPSPPSSTTSTLPSRSKGWAP